MGRAILLAALLTISTGALAKSETARIEIARGKHTIVTLSGEESAGQFTIWSGPGTSAGPVGEPAAMTTSGRDFADWLGGAVEPPRKLQVYKVRFYCAARGENARESIPSSLCYGVRYAVDPATGLGYFQIPAEGDAEFRANTRSIYRGVEGSWYRSSDRWEELVRPRIEAALAAKRGGDYPWNQPYIHVPSSSPPSRTAVGARPSIPTKTR
jgi:hypothetical protein